MGFGQGDRAADAGGLALAVDDLQVAAGPRRQVLTAGQWALSMLMPNWMG
jgi:hypothetical protein